MTSFSKADLGRLVTSEAIDRTARIVTSSGQATVEPKAQPNHPRFDVCPEVSPFPGPAEHDLTGRRVGHFRVIGYGGSGAGGARWVVRCDCGYYELRKSNGLKGVTDATALNCRRCSHVEYLKTKHLKVWNP